MQQIRKGLIALLLALVLSAPFLVHSAEISSSTWSETDASNNTASPDGFPEGMAMSGLNNSGRQVMGAVKRMWGRLNGAYASTGSANAYVLTPTSALGALVTGERYSFRANFSNTGSATLNISGLGATTIQKMTASGLANLAADDIRSGQPVTVEYNGSVFIMTTPLANQGGSVSSVATGGLATGGPITSTGTVTVTAATQSDMETGTSTTTAVVPGRQHNHPGHPKFWAVFDGSASNPITAGASYNLSSTITKNGTGDYTLAFTTSFSSTNYAVFWSVDNATGATLNTVFCGVHTRSTGSVRIVCNDSSSVAADPVVLSVSAFGDQ
jgi:hypothetical protein